MQLFHAPGACSLGIRMILEEIGVPYELRVVNLAAGEQRQPEYLAVNPKGKVPALLRDDGSILTEFPAIAMWLARQHPEAGLLPRDAEGEARTLEILDFIVATLHMRGTALVMRPSAFATSPEAQSEVAMMGKQAVQKGLERLTELLGDKPFLMGDSVTLADAAALYLLSWQPRFDMPLGGALQAYFARLSARPSAVVALAA